MPTRWPLWATKSPEKWEGLAVGPMLGNGSNLLLAGTDNDYSVTQSGSGTQFDVYFRFDDIDPYAGSIQCPLGNTTNCSFTTGGLATPLLAGYALLPGVLHAYTANIAGYVAAGSVPVPATLTLVAMGLALMLAGGANRRGQPVRSRL